MKEPKFTPEFWVQFVGFLMTGIVALGSTIAFCFMTFATKSEVQIEREERHELKAEIDTLYKVQIPPEERKPLAHPHKIGEE